MRQPRLSLFTALPRAAALMLAASFVVSSACAQADVPRAPRQLIESLGVEVRQRLEQPQAGKTPEAAERAVADQIAALARETAGQPALTAPDRYGNTPLMLAVSGAYPQVVKVLLADPGVRQQINAANAAGETAWMLANFAPRVTLAACQPGALTTERVALLPPYLRRMATLLRDEGQGLAAILGDLEAAGAQPDRDGARRIWLQNCPNAGPEFRARLAGDVPLLSTLVGEALARQLAFNEGYSKTPSTVADHPPPGTRFIADGPVPPQRFSKGDMTCKVMTKPDLRGNLDWRGTLTFKGTIATRAGVVEVADLELQETRLLDRAQDRAAVEYFRSAVVRGLGGYQCEGEHVFAQDFIIKVD